MNTDDKIKNIFKVINKGRLDAIQLTKTKLREVCDTRYDIIVFNRTINSNDSEVMGILIGNKEVFIGIRDEVIKNKFSLCRHDNLSLTLILAILKRLMDKEYKIEQKEDYGIDPDPYNSVNFVNEGE